VARESHNLEVGGSNPSPAKFRHVLYIYTDIKKHLLYLDSAYNGTVVSMVRSKTLKKVHKKCIFLVYQHRH
jgi:hypothetical protein